MSPTKALIKQNQGLKLHQLFLRENALLQKQDFVFFSPRQGWALTQCLKESPVREQKGTERKFWGVLVVLHCCVIFRCMQGDSDTYTHILFSL